MNGSKNINVLSFRVVFVLHMKPLSSKQAMYAAVSQKEIMTKIMCEKIETMKTWHGSDEVKNSDPMKEIAVRIRGDVPSARR